jgi:hypothetical protein
LCRAKNPAKNVWKYQKKYRRLRTHLYRQLHRQLHSELNLALYRNLDPSLFGALFAKTYESLLRQMLATLLGAMFDLMYGELQASSHVALNRQMLPPRRPVGRGVGGRIVVYGSPNTICCGCLAAPNGSPKSEQRQDARSLIRGMAVQVVSRIANVST